MAPAPLFEALYRSGRYGEKAGAGFYGYGSQTDEPVRTMIDDLQRRGVVRHDTTWSPERLMLPMVNEAALCLTEHIANANDIDMACIAGLGMKRGEARLGPLQLADEMGLDLVLDKLEALRLEFGERFRPARLLRTKVRAGHLGRKAGKGFREYT
mgnify:FL=1